MSDPYDPIRQAIAELEIDPADAELAELARQIALPVEPLEYQARAADEGEGEWWRDEPPGFAMPAWAQERRVPPASFEGSSWEYLVARAEDEGRLQPYLEQPREPSPDWWAGVLEGMRIGIELARLTANASMPAPASNRPAVGGRRVVR